MAGPVYMLDVRMTRLAVDPLGAINIRFAGSFKIKESRLPWAEHDVGMMANSLTIRTSRMTFTTFVNFASLDDTANVFPLLCTAVTGMPILDMMAPDRYSISNSRVMMLSCDATAR